MHPRGVARMIRPRVYQSGFVVLTHRFHNSSDTQPSIHIPLNSPQSRLASALWPTSESDTHTTFPIAKLLGASAARNTCGRYKE